MSHKILCALGCLDSSIALLLDLCSVPLVATDKTQYLWIILDFALLRIRQSMWRFLMAFEVAHGFDKIVTRCRTKVDGERVACNEVRHVISLIDISTITHNLPSLLWGDGFCIRT